jgi:hypothetical protein
MDFLQANGFTATILCIFSRLYFLSVLAVVVALIGDICAVHSLSAYSHQAIGSMLLTGGLWISSLAVHVIFSDGSRQQVEHELQSTIGR